MNVPLFLIVILATTLNISSFFTLAAKAPQYTMFTGAVHYPTDYQYYLSFITQGADHWIRSYHVLTGETTTLRYLNWIYVFCGHIGSLFHLSAPIIYQCMVILGSVAYLIIAYKLIGVSIKNNKYIQFLVYVLFLLSNAVPNIHTENGAWVFGYFYPFNNLGHPLLRLINVPHHLFISCLIMASFYVAGLVWQKNKVILFSVLLGILGFLLASMQPLQWVLVGGTCLAITFALWRKRRSIRLFVPFIIFTLAGLLPAWYLRGIFAIPPVSLTIAWEVAQQTRIPFIHFLRLNGPVMIIGIIGIPWIIRNMSISTASLLLYSVVTIVIFFSPIPVRLNLLNLRFISVIPTFTAALVAGECIWKIAKKLDRRRTIALSWFLAFFAIAITVPVTIKQYIERNNNASPQDMNAYLPFGARDIYEVAKDVVGPTDTVLTDFIFSTSFAGLTGKHVYAASKIQTVDFDRKFAESNTFFYHPGTTEERMDWLAKNNISYIVSYAWVPIDLPNVEIVAHNIFATLYRINSER
jgi:hypothetical protein